MTRRLTAALLALVLLCSVSAAAALTWPPEAGDALRQYIEAVNANLLSLGQRPVNSVFECYSGLASLGVTEADMGEVPEAIEMTVYMDRGELLYLQLRVTDTLDAFPAICAACIQAASPEAVTLKEAMAEPTRYLERVYKNINNSFEDAVSTLRGESVRMYYAYAPVQYPRQEPPVRTLQLTLVFPLPGTGSPVVVTPVPGPDNPAFNGEGSSEWDDRRPIENLSDITDDEYEPELHLILTTTPTPEPDIDWLGGE